GYEDVFLQREWARRVRGVGVDARLGPTIVRDRVVVSVDIVRAGELETVAPVVGEHIPRNDRCARDLDGQSVTTIRHDGVAGDDLAMAVLVEPQRVAVV